MTAPVVQQAVKLIFHGLAIPTCHETCNRYYLSAFLIMPEIKEFLRIRLGLN